MVIGSAQLIQTTTTAEGKSIVLQIGRRQMTIPVDEFPEEPILTQYELEIKPIGSGYDKNPLGVK